MDGLPQSWRVVSPKTSDVFFPIDVLHDADQAGQAGAQLQDQFLDARNLLGGRHQRELRLARGEGRAGHDGADDAGPFSLVVGGNAQFLHDLSRRADDLVGRLVLHAAGLQVDEAVAARLVQAGHQPAVLPSHLKLRLVAVAPGVLHADRLRHRRIFQPGVLAQRFDHQLPLAGQLGLVVHVLQAAAAAFLIDRTGGLDPRGGTLHHAHQPGDGVGFLDVCHFRVHHFPGQGLFHKDDFPLVIADAFAVDAEAFDRQGHLLADANGGFLLLIRFVHACRSPSNMVVSSLYRFLDLCQNDPLQTSFSGRILPPCFFHAERMRQRQPDNDAGFLPCPVFAIIGQRKTREL